MYIFSNQNAHIKHRDPSSTSRNYIMSRFVKFFFSPKNKTEIFCDEKAATIEVEKPKLSECVKINRIELPWNFKWLLLKPFSVLFPLFGHCSCRVCTWWLVWMEYEERTRSEYLMEFPKIVGIWIDLSRTTAHSIKPNWKMRLYTERTKKSKLFP